jgi:hypothetical protein
VKEIMKAVIGVKSKYAKNEPIVDVCDQILKFNDLLELLDEAIQDLEALANGPSSLESKKGALNKLNEIRTLISLPDIKEEQLVQRVDRIMKANNQLTRQVTREMCLVSMV